MKRKTKAVSCIIIVSTVSASFFLHGLFSYRTFSNGATQIDCPKNAVYDFSDFDMNLYEEYDVLETQHREKSGEEYSVQRRYYQNEKTGEKLIGVYRKDNGKFLKGCYFSDNLKSVYYSDNTAKIYGEKFGKIYCFDNSRLKYVSEMSVCKKLYSSVYVITYFDKYGNRTAVETRNAYHNGNVKAVKFLYERYYNGNFLPVSKKRFEKLIS